jgi:hypothetical protein
LGGLDVPQIEVHEGHEPDAFGDLRDADVLAGEDAAEIHFSAFEADPATAGDAIVWSEKRRRLRPSHSIS